MRLFAICPRIRKASGCVVATTAWRVRLLLLGTIYRRVVVDPSKQTIAIRSRYLWFICRKRTIRFSDIRAITYGYQDMAPDAALAYTHNSYDWFSVGLRLNDLADFHLFSFIGDGPFNNNGPLPDWVYWQEFRFNIVGSQEKESRVFVDLLSRMIDAPVVPPRSH